MRAKNRGQGATERQDQVLGFYLRSLLSQSYGQPEALAAERTEHDSTAPQPALPDWAQPEFQALCFRAGHMVLAVPLLGLRRIERLDDSTRVSVPPGMPDWFQGLVKFRDEFIQLADTELLIDGRRSAPVRGSGRYVLLLDQGPWGLVCDEIVDLIRLHESDVRWRVNRSQREWAAGTIIDRLCTLIDPPRLIPAGRCKDKRIQRGRRP